MTPLDKLLSPIPLETFAETICGVEHVHIRRDDPDYFSDLFTLQEVDDLLARDNLRYPTVKMWLDGQLLSPQPFLRSWSDGQSKYADFLDGDRVLELFDKGATISVLNVERLSQAVATLNGELSRQSGFATNTTGFLTPPSAANVPIHYDEQDFFVVQLFGTKRWKLWPAAPDASYADRAVACNYTPDDPVVSLDRLAADLTLRAGDTLYVPYGMIHQVVTTTDYSLHLTIGMPPLRTWDVLAALVKRSLEAVGADPAMRRSLPLAIGPDTDVALVQAEWGRLVEDFAARLHRDRVAALKRVRD